MIKTELIQRPRRSVLPTVLICTLGSAIVICGIGVTYMLQCYRLFKLSRTIHAGRERIIALKVKEETVLNLEAQLAQVNGRRATLDTLRNRRLSIYSIVTELEKSKPRAAELQFISVRPESIELAGRVPINRIAVDFVRQLKNSSLLSDAELVELKAIAGLYGLEFKIVVHLTGKP